MPNDDEIIECASFPAPMLADLADLRREPGVSVWVADERVWVRWAPARPAVLEWVRPIAGVELYGRRDGHWYRLGRRLPEFGLPVDSGGLPLHRALTPLPASPVPPDAAPLAPIHLGLVRDDQMRRTTAMECDLAELRRWGDMAPTARLGALRVARSGDRAIVQGSPLPPIACAGRFWGERVLTPLGLRPEPDLPERALREALGIGDDGLLILTPEGSEVVPLQALGPLTRAGLRLATEGEARP